MDTLVRILAGAGIGLAVGGGLALIGRVRTRGAETRGGLLRGAVLGAVFGVLIALTLNVGTGRPIETKRLTSIESAEQFTKLVTKAETPVVVDFFSTTCPPCARQAPILDRLAAETKPRAEFVKVDVDKLPQLAREHGVDAVPTLVLFAGGREAERWVGVTSGPDILAALNPLMTASAGKEIPMTEREGLVTLKGNAVTLLGDEVKVGDDAPDVTLIANDLSEIKLSSFKGKVVILSVVPSLDTPVCDTQTRRFNEEAAALGDNIAIVTISMDLPFAQKRWCGAAGVEKVQTLSDHRGADFGLAYGVLIKGLRLLARSIFVIDREGTLQYVQLVKEVATEPDYDAALEAAKKLVN